MSESESAKPSKINPRFRYEVAKMPGGEKLLQCFQCGTCTSDCPIARFNETYRPRNIIHMVQIGLKNKILESEFLWLCASCFTCTDRCPQGVEVASVIRILKNMAAEEGHVPQLFRDLLLNLLKTGYVYEIPESRIRRREALGLPPLPKGNSESILKTIQDLKMVRIVNSE